MHTVSLIVVGVAIGVVLCLALYAAGKKLKAAYSAWRANHKTLHARVEALEKQLAEKVAADAAAVAASASNGAAKT